MTQDQILGLVRHILTTSGGAAVAGGVATQDQMVAIVGGIVALAGAAWSYYAKRKAA